MSIDVLAAVITNPHVSTRDIAHNRDISRSSVFDLQFMHTQEKKVLSILYIGTLKTLIEWF